MMGQWEEDMATMQRGTRLLFLNDFAGAETVFKQAMQGAQSGEPAISRQGSLSSIAEEDEPEREEGVKDMRGAFALQYALVSVIKGVASLANDQLDECLQRLWTADELSMRGEDWVGRKVVRGVVTLMGGLVQCLQHSFVKGVYNILRSWVWIKCLPTEALAYKGKEAAVVRSSALFTLGIFNVLLSLLPPQMLKAASFLSGFEGRRSEGLKMLEECWKEEGMLSPWAALCLVAYKVDTKTFIGEKQTRADFEECTDIFAWAKKQYPNSVFFNYIEADLFACKKQLAMSRHITDITAPHVGKELRALEALLSYKRGVYALADLDFESASRLFENALNVYGEVGRRSLVPCMAMYAALGYLIVAEHQREHEIEHNNGYVIDIDEDAAFNAPEDDSPMNSITAAAHAERMLELIAKYKAMPKDNWGRQDLWAFTIHERYETKIENQWPLLDMVDCMVLRMRCSRWLNDEEADRLLKLVKCEENERENIGPDERIRVCAYFAEILNKRERYDDSLAWCDAGLKHQDKLSETGKDYGAAPLLIYLRALNMSNTERLLEAKATLLEIDQFGTSYWLYQILSFKVNVLTRHIDTQLEDKYVKLNIPAGKGESASIDISEQDLQGAEEEVCLVWEWLIEAKDVSFTAFFRPSNGADICIIQNVDRHESGHGPVAGRYVPDTPGSLQLEWDNRYSFLRPKVINYRLACTLR